MAFKATLFLPNPPPTPESLQKLASVEKVEARRDWLRRLRTVVLTTEQGTITLNVETGSRMASQLEELRSLLRKLTVGKRSPIAESVLRQLHVTRTVMGCIADLKPPSPNDVMAILKNIIRNTDGLIFADGAVTGKDGPIIRELASAP